MPAEVLPNHLQEIEMYSPWLYFAPNAFTALPLHIAHVTSRISIIDAFVWRTGVYVVFFLYLVLFLITRREKEHLFIILPSVATLFTLIVALNWQMYQYLWFFQLSIFIFTGYVLVVRKDRVIVGSNET